MEKGTKVKRTPTAESVQLGFFCVSYEATTTAESLQLCCFKKVRTSRPVLCVSVLTIKRSLTEIGFFFRSTGLHHKTLSKRRRSLFIYVFRVSLLFSRLLL